MSISINNYQKERIKKYFNLLVAEFIKEPPNCIIDINLVFKDYLKRSENYQTLGHTDWKYNEKYQQTINGQYVPNSEVITHNFEVAFLNSIHNIEDKERWRGTVVHEFTHVYLFFTVGNHDHDDRFYSYMEYFENWLDKNQGLNPRKDKSGDRDQYIGDNKFPFRDQPPKNNPSNNPSPSPDNSKKETVCPECSYPTHYHSPQCSCNPNNPQKSAEFHHLQQLLSKSPDLTTLENNYQICQKNPLYNENEQRKNKEKLDSLYKIKKMTLHNHSVNSSLNKTDSAVWYIFYLTAITLMILIIIYLLGTVAKYPTKRRK